MEKSKKNRLFGHPAGKRRSGPNPTQIICVSFLVVITLGTLLLTTPLASKQGRLGVVDALFTATSATCVTGLIVRDTWTQFSYFGQAVILVLIQVGGLGLVTLTSFFALAMRRRMGFRDLRLMGESVSADGYAQAKEVLKTVVGLAALFEGIGILLLLFVAYPMLIAVVTRRNPYRIIYAAREAMLLDIADVAGKRVWRLRIGPVAATTAPQLAARVVGLGFGQPQRVRD